jgi:phospholipase/carboxylesterase
MAHTIGSLQCTLLEAQGKRALTVILCHGFGAPANDLVGLAPALRQLSPALSDVRFVFPHGPLPLEFGPDARAWWPIDMEALMSLRARGPAAIADYRQAEPPGLPAARAALKGLLEILSREEPMGSMVLGGFSQGAMLTCDTALTLEEAPAGLIALSGTLLKETAWRERASKRQGLPVFISHGRADMVLDFFAAQQLEQVLAHAGLKTEFHPFDDGHTIPPQVLKSLAGWLTERRAQLMGLSASAAPRSS